MTVSGGSFHMYGGEISNGTAVTYAGNISFVTSSSSGLLLGGQIRGGSAGDYANCVYVNNNNVVVGGTVQVDELLLGAGKSITVSTEASFAEGAAIGLALLNPPTNYSTVIQNYSDLQWFACTMENYILDVNDNTIVMRPQ